LRAAGAGLAPINNPSFLFVPSSMQHHTSFPGGGLKKILDGRMIDF
jgi:hypothetical protein